ncbi:unnamed protein product [Colias eurytheme]|nr:unnamed protein product [Colias eurytheme]
MDVHPSRSHSGRSLHVRLDKTDRPFSESDIERPSQAPPFCRLSASSPPLTFPLDMDLDDDVFVSPRTDSGNDPFSTTNIEIFRYGSPRTPAGVLLSPRRDSSFSFLTSEKHWRDKGGTDVADGIMDTDVMPTCSDGAITRDVGKKELESEKRTKIIMQKVKYGRELGKWKSRAGYATDNEVGLVTEYHRYFNVYQTKARKIWKCTTVCLLDQKC